MSFLRGIVSLIVEVNPALAKYRLIMLGVAALLGTLFGDQINFFASEVCNAS